MRVIATLQPSLGHLHTVAPVLKELGARGHDLLVATSASFDGEVKKAGFTTVSCGRDWREDDASDTWPEFVLGGPLEQLRLFAGLAGAFAVDVDHVARSFRPDLIVRDSLEFGGWLLAEARGVALATVGVTLPIPARTIRHTIGSALAASAKGFGVDLRSRLIESLSGSAYIDSSPQVLLSRRSRKIPHRVSIAPVRHDWTGQQLPDSVRSADGPLVYVSLGTVFNRLGFDLFELLVDAVERVGARSIVTVGDGVDLARLGSRSSVVWATNYAPQAAILPKCSAAIIHGGYNTVIGALATGTPCLCIPLSADQTFNARACAAAGVGRSLNRRPLFDGTRRAARLPAVDRVTLELSELLGTRSYLDEARRTAELIQEMPPVSDAVDLLESAVAGSATSVAAR